MILTVGVFLGLQYELKPRNSAIILCLSFISGMRKGRFINWKFKKSNLNWKFKKKMLGQMTPIFWKTSFRNTVQTACVTKLLVTAVFIKEEPDEINFKDLCFSKPSIKDN